jgi:hypothetical protein
MQVIVHKFVILRSGYGISTRRNEKNSIKILQESNILYTFAL